jgi:hypothetical protein
MRQFRQKALFSVVFLACFSYLAAWEMPPRFFEIALDAEAGAANSYLSLGDFFNSARTLRLNIDSLGSQEFGLNFIAGGNFALNVQTRGKHWVSAGLYTGFDTFGFFTIPEDAMAYLFHDGNLSSLNGSLEVGGSIFADMGIKTSFKAGKFRFIVNPAMYIPVVYMAKPDITYQITGVNPLNGFLHANAVAYTAVPVDRNTLESPPYTAYTTDDIIDDIFNAPRGFDLSVDVSYSFFPVLDAGGSISHIPLYPAYMQYGAKVDKTYIINPNNLNLPDFLDEDLDNIDLDSLISPLPGIDDLEYFSDAREAVFRPLRFSAYGFYKPFRKDWLAFKPWLGVSVFTVYDTACFNFGLDAQFKIVNMLNFYYAFSHIEKVWQNRLNVGVNVRILELLAGAGIRSRDFVGAWNIKGAYVTLGLRIGF